MRKIWKNMPGSQVAVTAIAFLAVCFAAEYAFCASGTTAKEVGAVTVVEGTVVVVNEDAKPAKLQLKSPVYLNDRIKTGPDSRLQIMFDDDSVISQGENSELVIDEYVYSPRNKEEVSCSVRIARGIFRVLTGKITDLNPKRFRVRTGMATIGIRGCDLGFTVNEDSEDVLVLGLPEGKSILIEKFMDPNASLQDLLSGPSDAISIVEPGIAVTILPAVGLQERIITEAETKAFMARLLAQGKKDEGDNLEDPAGSDDLSGIVRDVDMVLAAAPVDANQAGSDSEEDNGSLAGPPPPDSLPSLASRPPANSQPTEPPPDVAPPTAPPTGPSPTIPPPPPTRVAHAIGQDWLWGIWSDGTMDHSGTWLAQTDIQEIAAGAQLYDLAGTGNAGAMLEHGGESKLVTGSCQLNLQIGQSVTPMLGGAFSLGNTDGDVLVFDVMGHVGTDGKFLSNQTAAYAMQVGGVPFDQASLTGQRIECGLVGPAGAAVPPITGAVGDFTFLHGSLARADGRFGADVR